MKRNICLILFACLLLTACGAPAESTAPSSLTPLVQVPTGSQTQPVETTAAPEEIMEVPGRVYDVPWQDRTLSEEGGYLFADSTIPVFLFTQEEIDGALAKLEDYIEKEYMDDEGALRYTMILGIAPDFLAASEYVSPENRKAEGINRAGWAQENYYAHYMDFDVILCADNAGLWGISDVQVFNVSLYRDDATDPTGWRVRTVSGNMMELPYRDLTQDGTEFAEAYRPLNYDELAQLGDLGGTVLFATEMLYQENTTWVYVYMEDTNEIVRKEIARSDPGVYTQAPSIEKGK